MSEPTQEPNGVTFQPSPEFLVRAKRMDDAMHLRKPDRIPVAPLCIHFYATKVRDIMKKLLELVDEMEKGRGVSRAYAMEMMQLGYPIQWVAATYPPFDWISDCFRGLKGSSMDMYRAPEKLLSTIDMITPMTIGGAVGWAEQARNKGVAIFMHRGATGFMSDEQFAKFYWPSFKALLLGLVDAGLTPIALFEGDYTSRLEYLQELPRGKIVGHFDRVDRKKAKKLISNVMCFWGNVPASLMCAGTPQQVKDDVKKLIDTFGDNGGLIIDSINGFPDESKPENIRAVSEAVMEYGVY